VAADGETITTNVGRFGPYVKYGSKYVSLKEDDPYTITHERALEVIRLKQEADANRLILDFPDDGIQVLNGRYGPYITDKKKNAKIPKDRDPKTLTIEECKALIAAAPERGGGRFGRFRGKKKGAAAAPEAGTEATAESGKGAAKKKKAANGAAKTGAGKKPTHATPASQGAAASAAAPRAAAKAAAKKAAPHDGHKAAPTKAKDRPAQRRRRTQARVPPRVRAAQSNSGATEPVSLTGFAAMGSI
jgi:DNA topoisomerase-1